MSSIPEHGFMDLPQIVTLPEVTQEQAEWNRRRGKGPRRPRRGERGVFPFGRSTWWAGVRAGKFPQPVKVGRRTLWRAEDIRRLVEEISGGGA